MREIKFRAWNKFGKFMLQWDDFVNYEKDQQAIVGDKYRIFNDGEFVLQQYTEMRDVNENEIYEGDIISDWVDADGRLVQSKMKVYWCNKSAAWKLDYSFEQDSSSGVLLSEELERFLYEITGNIYEK